MAGGDLRFAFFSGYAPVTMRLTRFGTVVLCLAVGVACSSTSAEPSGSDASGSDGASAASEAGSPDAPTSDAPASDAPAPSDDSSLDASSPDTTVEQCAHAPFDASVPADAECGSRDDTDHDGVIDCIDGCPYDPNKIAPGECGCNIPDVDSDGDGVADCIDLCPADPNNTANEQCGCVGEPGLQAAGTPCSDPACPQTGSTCNGSGVCGDRSSCSPCAGGHFIESEGGRQYWFCGTSLPPVSGPGCVEEDGGGGPGATWMAAQSACAAKGLTLARIESIDESDFITGLMTARLWIGANDLQTAGQWYWSSATSNSDTLLWEGGVDGSRQNDLFFNWAPGAPGDASCASMSPANGEWSDTDCSQTLGYVCE